MSRSVPRIGRVLDLLGLVVLLAGAACYGWAWLGLRRLQVVQPGPEAGPFAAIREADRLSGLSRLGMGVMLVGIAVMVTAAIVARRVRTDRSTGA